MNIDDIQSLYAYNRWASIRMFSALEKLSEQQFTAAVQSSFPSIRETIFHLLAAEWIWLRRWKGTSPQAVATTADGSLPVKSGWKAGGIPTPEELASLAALQEFWNSIEEERHEFLAGLADEELQASLDYRNMAGKAFSAPLVQLMQHVVNHGTYHRGQVITLLRQAGAETASLDMVYFFLETNEKAAAASRT